VETISAMVGGGGWGLEYAAFFAPRSTYRGRQSALMSHVQGTIRSDPLPHFCDLRGTARQQPLRDDPDGCGQDCRFGLRRQPWLLTLDRATRPQLREAWQLVLGLTFLSCHLLSCVPKSPRTAAQLCIVSVYLENCLQLLSGIEMTLRIDDNY
jgi:hypothetical protein